MPAASRARTCDEAERASFALPPDHRVQRDGGADTGEGHDHLEYATDEDRGFRTRADNVVVVVHRPVQGEGRDRGEREHVEHARDQRPPAQLRIHRGPLGGGVVRSMIVMAFLSDGRLLTEWLATE